jgi:hypothetical protein
MGYMKNYQDAHSATLGYQMSRFSWTCAPFQASEMCQAGIFNFTKMSGFLAFVDIPA